MKTLGTKWLRILKISHLLFATMWIGGVMALVSLQLGLTPQTKEMMYMAAQAHLIVDEYFLIPGGIGILATALLYGTLTKVGILQAALACREMDIDDIACGAWRRLYGSDYQGEPGVCPENIDEQC